MPQVLRPVAVRLFADFPTLPLLLFCIAFRLSTCSSDKIATDLSPSFTHLEAMDSGSLRELFHPEARTIALLSPPNLQFGASLELGPHHFFVALGTDPMAERGFRVFSNIGLHLLPVVVVIANSLAVGADGQQSL